MPNPAAIAAAHARAIAACGQPVTFQRIALAAPLSTVSASVTAVVRRITPDTSAVSREGYSASKPGAITQGDRQVIAMKSDLAAAGFPLPVQKGDRVQVAETGEWLQVEEVDNAKRHIAACVELIARGVA